MSDIPRADDNVVPLLAPTDGADSVALNEAGTWLGFGGYDVLGSVADALRRPQQRNHQ